MFANVLQMSCMPNVTTTTLLSYLSETKKFSMFLIERNKPFIPMLMILCKFLLSLSDMTCFIVFDNEFSRQLSSLTGVVHYFILSFQFSSSCMSIKHYKLKTRRKFKTVADETRQIVLLKIRVV